MKDDKVREITIEDNVRIKSKPRLYEAIIKNSETNAEKNRSDPLDYDSALAWGRNTVDDESYCVIERFKENS